MVNSHKKALSVQNLQKNHFYENKLKRHDIMIHYFDNCATTQVDGDIAEIIAQYHTTKYFNPSARSSFSLQIANDIALAHEKVAKALGATAQ